ncbi:MAG TPA: YdiU family protein [Gammaproteobacteria bacterium]|nr:YdiU family protein [Gammaproteobacteria bacterium]
MIKLQDTTFRDHFSETLPADPHTDNSPRRVAQSAFSWVSPEPVSAPKTIAYSKELLTVLGWPESEANSELFAQVFSGNRLLSGMRPYAMCYGGHQFGHWAGQLGDGRAINLGGIDTETEGHLTLQLKGAGPTPYSRRADGRAVLRSSLREFLCSEAMYHLGIPTTRALSLVSTGEQIERDMFYDGHPELEPGAIVCRVAPSFIRFGHFELPTAREEYQLLEQLVKHCLKNDYKDKYAYHSDGLVDWFRDVCLRTADLMVHWMRVGFVHGVMNTDNMSILGLTIDYGPYGWLEAYDPHWTPNTTDAQGRRYCYGKQPEIAQWNLMALANGLYPLIGESEPLEEALTEYAKHYQRSWRDMMCAKLGMQTGRDTTDDSIIHELLSLLGAVEADWTLFFRALSRWDPQVKPQDDHLQGIVETFYLPEKFSGEVKQRWLVWLQAYGARILHEGQSTPTRIAQMNSVNPIYIMRNYLVHQAIEQVEKGDISALEQLMLAMRQPYEESDSFTLLTGKRPDWARHKAGCSMLSCSS